MNNTLVCYAEPKTMSKRAWLGEPAQPEAPFILEGELKKSRKGSEKRTKKAENIQRESPRMQRLHNNGDFSTSSPFSPSIWLPQCSCLVSTPALGDLMHPISP